MRGMIGQVISGIQDESHSPHSLHARTHPLSRDDALLILYWKSAFQKTLHRIGHIKFRLVPESIHHA